MSEVNIREIAHQATPYLNFADSDGNKVSGSSLSVVEFRPPDMSQATGETIAIQWRNTEPISVTPHVIDTAEFSNGSNAIQSQTFSRSYTDTRSFTWTLSEKIQLGAKTKGKTNFIFAEAAVELSFQFEFGSTQSWTNTHTEQFTVNFPLQVPAHSIVQARWLLQQLKNVVLPFTAIYELSGTISLALLTLTDEYTWAGSVGELINAAIKGGAKNWKVKGDIANLSFGGKLLADQGVMTQVVITQKKIDSSPE